MQACLVLLPLQFDTVIFELKLYTCALLCPGDVLSNIAYCRQVLKQHTIKSYLRTVYDCTVTAVQRQHVM